MSEEIKQAFSKVKEDIFFLGKQVEDLRAEITDLKDEIKLISDFINDFKLKILKKEHEKVQEITKKPKIHIPTHLEKTPTDRQINQTNGEIPTDKLLSQVLKRRNLHISTGNGGVPTDRQTDRQTDRHMKIVEKTPKKPQIIFGNMPQNPEKQDSITKIDHLEKAGEILNTLDALKKELRLKIKKLTSKEISVLTLLYDLENQGQIVDYPLLSSKLNLSQSSIRDYIGKIQVKGIPIIKEKLNNKKIVLHISSDLKKIASLDTILKLRNL